MTAFELRGARGYEPLLRASEGFVGGDPRILSYMDGGSGEVRIMDEGGGLRRILRFRFEPRPVSDNDLESARAERRLGPRYPDEPRFAAVRALRARRVEEVTGAASHPFASDLLVDGDGDIWFQLGSHFAPDSTVWLEIDQTDQSLRRLELAAGQRPLDFRGDLALILTRDELDVEVVTVTPLVPSPFR